jgi:hypothetical protein
MPRLRPSGVQERNVMVFRIFRRTGLAVAIIAVAGLVAASATASAHSVNPPQHKQIAAATLSGFRVVLTATRGPGTPPTATVSAAGFRRAGGHWALISRQRIGKANQWFWFAVSTCALTIRQFVSAPRTHVARSIRVSLLVTPSIGCSRSISKHWPR